jgi:hypothetical protein
MRGTGIALSFTTKNTMLQKIRPSARLRLAPGKAFLLCALLFHAWNPAKGQTGYVWCKTIQSTGWDDSGMDVDCSPDGKVFICGDYNNNAGFGGTPRTSIGSSDIYTCRLGGAGNFEWVHTEGSLSQERLYAVRHGDVDGHVYAGGYGLVIFPSHRTAMHAWDALTIRLRPNGDLHWGWAMEGGGALDYSETRDIAPDASGNSYSVGELKNDGWYGTDTIQGRGAVDAFVVKFDSVGDFQWGQAWGGSMNDQANGVDVDANGNIWVGGSFQGNGDFGGQPLVSAGNSDAFIAKVGPAGNVLFARQISGSSFAEVVRLKVSADGDCYFTGNFAGSITVGSQSLTAVDTLDVFYGKMDAAGNVLWARQAGGMDMNFVQDLDVDGEENLYLGGFFFGDMAWQGDTIVSQAFDDLFFAKTDSNGTLTLLKASHDPGSRDVFGIAVDPAQNILLTGIFSDTMTLGSPTYNSTLGTFDIFIAKYATRSPEIALLDIVGTPYCSSDQFQVTFQAWGSFDSTNVFHLELSDSGGNFAGAQVIGSLIGMFGGTISGTIPPGILQGTGYRMRIRSSSPVQTSPDNGYDIPLYPTTAIPVAIGGDTVLCNGNPVTLWVDPGFIQLVWSTGDSTDTIVVAQAGPVWVEATDSNGCSNRAEVTVVPCVGMETAATGVQLRIHPQPVGVNGAFRVMAQGLVPGAYRVAVVDGHGRVVHVRDARVGSAISWIQMEIPGLAAGIYHLHIAGPGGAGHLRFVRQ